MAEDGISVPVAGAERSIYRPRRRQAAPGVMQQGGQWLDETLRRYGGPHLYSALVGSNADPAVQAEVGPNKGGLVQGLVELTPGADMRDAKAGAGALMEALLRGDPAGAVGGGGLLTAAMLGTLLPGSVGGLQRLAPDVGGATAARAAGRIRPPSDNLRRVLDSNFQRGRVLGEETVPIDSLAGGISPTKVDQARVDELVKEMTGKKGYISRLVADAEGNVIEGQHRLAALRRIGINEVPIVRVGEAWDGLPVERMRLALVGSGLKSQQRDELLAEVGDMVRESGSVKEALQNYDLPPGKWGDLYRGVLEAIEEPAPAAKGIRAFHGSPHDFERFSTTQVGRGQGAQSYGHGLYFAENEDVARTYRNQLRDAFFATSDVGNLSRGDAFEALSAKVRESDPSLSLQQSDAIASNVLDGVEEAGSIEKYVADFELPAGPKGMFKKGYEAAAREAERLGLRATKGRMYEVAINAKPEDFIDWDKPLHQQSEKVQRALGFDPQRAAQYREVTDKYDEALYRAVQGDKAAEPEATRLLKQMREFEKRGAGGAPPADRSGESLMTDLMLRHGSPEKAAAALREAGIVGVRYLDQGSRGAFRWTLQSPAENTTGKWRVKQFGGANAKTFETEEAARAFMEKNKPTNNYVIFDDSTLEIIRKYGLAPLLAGGAGGVALMSGGEAEAAAP